MAPLPLSAVAMMLAAMTLIPLGDTFGKLLATEHGVAPAFVGWSRMALGAALCFGWLAARGQAPGLRLFRDPRLWLRGALISCGIFFILTALRTEPIANVFGAFFTGPILSYALSALLLGERTSRARTFLLLLGFAGVLLVVRPGFGMTPGLGFALLAGVFYGAYLTASRWLRTAAPPGGLLLSQLVAGAVLLAPFGLAALPHPSATVAWLTLGSASASMMGNLILILAYGRAEAGRLAPFVYFQLVAATGLGMLVFGAVPDALAAAGLALLCATGFATLRLRT